MKKIFASAALAAMMIAAPAFAQNQTQQAKSVNAGIEKKCDLNKDCKRQKGEFQLGECPKGACEFEGLNLTEDQKTQLKNLKQSRMEARKAQKDSMKSAKEADKQQKMADREAFKQKREAERRSYLQEVKKIIGPDNYLLFLENQFVQQGGTDKPKGMGGQGGPRMDKKKGQYKGEMKQFCQKDSCKKDAKKCDKKSGKKSGKKSSKK